MKNSIDKTQSPFDSSNAGIGRLLARYMGYWKWFAVSFVVFAALCTLYLIRATPLYKVRASILIKEVVSRDNSKFTGESLTSQADLADIFAPKKIVENEIQILSSRTIMGQVVDELGLAIRYTEGAQPNSSAINAESLPFTVKVIEPWPTHYNQPVAISLDDDGEVSVDGMKSHIKDNMFAGPYGRIEVSLKDSIAPGVKSAYINFTNRDAAIDYLLANFEVASDVKGSTVLDMTLVIDSPRLGENILGTIVKAYNMASIRDKNGVTEISLHFIEERLKELAADLRNIEAQAEEYRTANSITNLTSESESILQAMIYNNQSLTNAQSKLELLRTLRQQVADGKYPAENISAAMGINDYSLGAQIVELSKLEADRIKALHTVKQDNIIIRSYDDQIADLKQKVLSSITLAGEGIEIGYKNALGEKKRLDKVLQSIPMKERRLMEITRELDNKNQLYVNFLSKKEDLELIYASTIADYRLVDAPYTFPVPVKPVKSTVAIFFMLLAFIVPLAAIWLSDLFNNKVKTKEDILNSSPYPIVGEILLSADNSHIIDMVNDRGLESEQFRTLRTNVSFMQSTVHDGARVVLVTSNVSGEGKTFIAANIGATFAASGKKTVVLGFDMRKPGSHKMFGASQENGLSDFLTGQLTLEAITHRIGKESNLFFIAGGRQAPNVQELLEGGMITELFSQLSSMYDYIIVDTAPAGMFSDAALLNRFADTVLCIVRQGVTRKDMIRNINDSGRYNNLGIVINGIDRKNRYGYYGYYGLGGYNYDSYYGK